MTRSAVHFGSMPAAFLILLLSSCASGSAPEPTAVAQAVAATLTAWAPVAVLAETSLPSPASAKAPPPTETTTAIEASTRAPTSTTAPTRTPARMPTATTPPTKAPTLKPTATSTSALPPLQSPKRDGSYIVGEDIAPGKWESTGASGNCYWARLGDYQETLDNHAGLAGGTVTILVSDYEVTFSGCGTWRYVEGLQRSLQPDAAEPKTDGFYTVGVEIVPGKWESTGMGGSCYWARLGDYQETLDNHAGLAGGTATILIPDYEVTFSGCGIWQYVEGLDRRLQPDATDPKRDGFYTVGVEIAPGRWRSTGAGAGCYWARLDQYQDTFDNYYGHAGGDVTILASDYEVLFKGCGTWEYVRP
jgi:hypothetical protein